MDRKFVPGDIIQYVGPTTIVEDNGKTYKIIKNEFCTVMDEKRVKKYNVKVVSVMPIENSGPSWDIIHCYAKFAYHLDK